MSLTEDYYATYAALEAAPGQAAAERRQKEAFAAADRKKGEDEVTALRQQARQQAEKLETSMKAMARECSAVDVIAEKADGSGRAPDFAATAAALGVVKGVLDRGSQLRQRLETLRRNRAHVLAEIAREQQLAQAHAAGRRADQIRMAVMVGLGLLCAVSGNLLLVPGIVFVLLGRYLGARAVKGPSAAVAEAVTAQPAWHGDGARLGALVSRPWWIIGLVSSGLNGWLSPVLATLSGNPSSLLWSDPVMWGVGVVLFGFMLVRSMLRARG